MRSLQDEWRAILAASVACPVRAAAGILNDWADKDDENPALCWEVELLLGRDLASLADDLAAGEVDCWLDLSAGYELLGRAIDVLTNRSEVDKLGRNVHRGEINALSRLQGLM